jgi:hypothetical protein
MDVSVLKEGDRIRLLMMPDDPSPLPRGSLGTVRSVTQFKHSRGGSQIHVKWDSGRTLMLCVPPDRFELVAKEG